MNQELERFRENDDYSSLFDIGPPPKRLIVMKPQYRNLFMRVLKEIMPDEFPSVSFKTSGVVGLYFEGPDTNEYLARVYFTAYDSPLGYVKPLPVVVYWSKERGEWLTLHEINPGFPEGEDPNEDEIDEALKFLHASIKSDQSGPLPTLEVKRSVLGWNDPITYEPIRNGEEVIRLQKDNRFIFKKKELEQWWLGKPTKNPMTNVVLSPSQIERFVIKIEEDAGEEPKDGGRRKRRRSKTMRRKNLRSTRKRK